MMRRRRRGGFTVQPIMLDRIFGEDSAKLIIVVERFIADNAG
jgi:hypothetical protein